ncbi:hypothetical protein Acsp04_42380 [Actinomadura sp. NBRC 104425]|nr:hypothetical protein Acsp04_42380 [Actinomadura sp. NBRC 104425]
MHSAPVSVNTNSNTLNTQGDQWNGTSVPLCDTCSSQDVAKEVAPDGEVSSAQPGRGWGVCLAASGGRERAGCGAVLAASGHGRARPGARPHRGRQARGIRDGHQRAEARAAAHGLRGNRSTAPELWIWARTVPAPQLVVSIFDCARHALPRTAGTGLLDEHGKGLDLVAAVTADWGTGPSRSRLSTQRTPGKTVWFALPLPFRWPGRHLRIHPGTAAQTLTLNLSKRGYTGRRSSDEQGVSVVELPGLNVWVLPQHFCWQPAPGRCVRRPLIDLQETAELLVRHLESTPAHRPTATPPHQPRPGITTPARHRTCERRAVGRFVALL